MKHHHYSAGKIRSKPNRVAFLSSVLKSLKEEKDGQVEENENSSTISAAEADASSFIWEQFVKDENCDKWIQSQNDTVTSVVSSGRFIAWATQAEVSNEQKYCLILKKKDQPTSEEEKSSEEKKAGEEKSSEEKKAVLFVSQMIQDIAFDNRNTPQKLVAVAFDKKLYLLDLKEPREIKGWTYETTLECHVPTSVAIISDPFKTAQELIGVGTTNGAVLFFCYNSTAEVPLTPHKFNKPIKRKDAGNLTILRESQQKAAMNVLCACGLRERVLHVVM